MRPKIYVPPCRFCERKFHRSEHLHRHERTHTREKPYTCDCGRAFSRRDLLSRHARLSHGHGTAPQDAHPPTNPEAGGIPPAAARDEGLAAIPSASHPQQGFTEDTRAEPVVHPGRPVVPSPEPNHPNAPETGTASRAQNTRNYTPQDVDADNEGNLAAHGLLGLSHFSSQPQFPGPVAHHDAATAQPISDMAFGADLDLLWSDADMYSPLNMTQSYPLNVSMLSQAGFPEFDVLCANDKEYETGNQQQPDVDDVDESGVMSRFASRLPSMQPEDQAQDHSTHETRQPEATQPAAHIAQDASTPRLAWRLSNGDYHLVSSVIQSHADALPAGFVLPSRHALCRYVEGFFTGFHEHLPIIHMPTFSLAVQAPELILAIAAVGALYRFQRRQSRQLYRAARAILECQLILRDEYDAPDTVFNTPGALADGNSQAHSTPSPIGDRPGTSSPNAGRPAATTTERDMQTMHAMILLIALGTWNHRSLIRDAFSTASQLALLVQEHAASAPDADHDSQKWEEWIAAEGRRRTMIVAYCFLNLHSIAYNIAPKVLNRDIGGIRLPAPESHWRAESEGAWAAARERDVYRKTSLQPAHASLFAPQPGDGSALSSFGNYVLIHCIIQEIFFARQLYFTGMGAAASLAPEVLPRLDSALRNWQRNWESTKDSSFDPSAPGGPLSFNATALFRLAYIRLHTDLGPHRQLASRHPWSISRAFRDAPLLDRSPYVARAVLQCAHSLSIPVRIGIEFVARTQTLTWSIVHSLCNLECGLFLGKWLETIASVLKSGGVLRDDERRLLGIITSIVSETDLGPQVQEERDPAKKVRRISAAVMRLWAYTFKGAHVFEIMAPIGAGLDLCADMLQQDP